MRDAAVGHQCAECVSAGARTVPTAANAVRRPNAARRYPFVTYGLIALNVLLFVAQTAVAEIRGGADDVVARRRRRRSCTGMITSAFLHNGITHILFNMFALFVVGPPLEIWLGRLRFSRALLLSALGGSVLIYLFSPLNVPTVGASGAVFGLFAATFVVAKKVNVDVRWVVIMIVINLVITFTVPSISWQGHLGGLVTGGLVALAYAYAPRENRNLVQAGATVGILVLFAALIWWRTTNCWCLLTCRRPMTARVAVERCSFVLPAVSRG